MITDLRSFLNFRVTRILGECGPLRIQKIESAKSVSVTLRAKGLVKIQIGSPSETTSSVYQDLKSNKIQTDLACRCRYTHQSHICCIHVPPARLL